jgi:hypothetical protein
VTPHDPFADLQSSLTLNPSRDFAARVRERVNQAPPRRQPAFLWAGGILLAGAAASLVIVTAHDSRERADLAPDTRIAQAPQRTSEAGAPTAIAMPHRFAPVVSRKQAGSDVIAPDPFYEVLVPDDQRVALERLLAAMKAGRTVVPRAATTSPDEDGAFAIEPLPDIVPIRIELLAGTPADPAKREIKKEPR